MAERADIRIGVLCLDTAFTKILGHIRNPATFDFPVVYRVVQGATPRRVVSEADPTLLEPFIDAARALESEGVAAITAACGFLVIFQQRLADAVRIPLYSSSLIQLPMVHRMVAADRTIGLLVADENALTRRHLEAIGGESLPLCVAGMAAHPEFREVILEGRRNNLDADRLGREVLTEVGRLAAHNPDLGALIIECTDLVPYRHAIQRHLGVPVFDIVTLTEMVHRTLDPGNRKSSP
ncbi:aspartate/glutamate racemase family protein [Nocardia acidivorans]|uniref:aspartate/glutamate racemase family protein n=1 Tax=Nocardia acidivorans TaxID=404580 RepID=UPI00082B57AA|nr:aspartate/glutamate racemase family protein [Nocardia acidivorans]